TRNLLAAEQARALEQERMLASERAKMARAGIGVDGFPASKADDKAPLGDLDGGNLVDLGDKPGDKTPDKAGGKSAKPSVAAAKKPVRPGTAVGRPTAQELDHALASLTDDDEDESSFADLEADVTAANTTAKKKEPEPDAPTLRSPARS